MSTPLRYLAGTRKKLRLGIVEVTARPLTLRDLGELEEVYLRLFPGDEAVALSPEWNRKFLSHPDGAAAVLRCVGRKDHPELESDPDLAGQLFDEASLVQWKELIAFAFQDHEDPKATA